VAVLVDTGVFVSAADADEPRHHQCAHLLDEHRGELVVAAPVVPETAWLLEDRLGPSAEVRFLRLVTACELRVVDLVLADYQRCVTLIERYADLSLGLVDASIVTVAENLVRPRWPRIPSRRSSARALRVVVISLGATARFGLR